MFISGGLARNIMEYYAAMEKKEAYLHMDIENSL